jgi:hypothetical protein
MSPYLEEEAVKTYTHALHDIDSGGDAAVGPVSSYTDRPSARACN